MAEDTSTTSIDSVTRGLSAKEKLKVESFFTRMRERQKLGGKQRRDLARQEQLIPSLIADCVGGITAEGVRRKLVGRVTKEARGQGIGMIVAGVTIKLGGKYLRSPLLARVGDAHVSQGAALVSLETIYGEDDPMILAVEGTASKALKDK